MQYLSLYGDYGMRWMIWASDCCTACRPALEPTSDPIKLVLEFFTAGLKRPGCEVQNSPPCSAKLSYTYISPLCLHAMDRDNFFFVANPKVCLFCNIGYCSVALHAVLSRKGPILFSAAEVFFFFWSRECFISRNNPWYAVNSAIDCPVILFSSSSVDIPSFITKTKLHGLSPRANYTDRVAAAGQRS